MSDDADSRKPDSTGEPPEAAIREALAEVRKEGLKAAVLVAAVDATLAAALVTLASSLSGIPALSRAVAGSVTGGHVLAVLAAVAVGGAELAWRRRRPTVERFEAGNPEVREALRTARDAVDADRADSVARTLYEDVLERLSDTSSLALVPWRRLGATVVLVVLVSGLTLAVSVGAPAPAPTATDPGPSESVDGSVGGQTNGTEGLRDGDEVLGDPTNVSAGDRNLTASVEAGTGGEGDREPADRGGYGGDDRPAVESQRAGYASTGSVEDADLIREYTLALQDTTASNEGEDGDEADDAGGSTDNESRTDGPDDRETLADDPAGIDEKSARPGGIDEPLAVPAAGGRSIGVPSADRTDSEIGS